MTAKKPSGLGLPKIRESAEYRAERLEEERERLERRRAWAMRRGDGQGVARLTERIEAIEEAIDADLSPGRQPGRHDWHRYPVSR